MTRRMRSTIVVAVVGLMLAFGNVAFADHLRAICDVKATASAKLDQGYVLGVRLHTSDNKPVNETAVRFYQVVDFFGQREEYLGSAVTDGQGAAAFPFLPATLGHIDIVARSGAHDHFSAAEGRTAFEATVAAPAYTAELVPLSGFTKVVTGAVGAVILSVWLLIGFALISTARGVRRGARDFNAKGDHA